MHRVSTDVGDKSVKTILNSFSKYQDPEISFPHIEKKGSLCAGINRSVIIAYCEDL